MRPKSIVLLVLALGCGLVASIGINQVMAKRPAPEVVGAETTPIYVALTDVAMGDPLTLQMVKLEEWPKDKVQPGALSDIEDVEGRRCRVKIFAGEPILEPKLLAKGETQTNATDLIPKGYRVVAVRVDPVSSASGLIQAGDRVDLLVHVKKNPNEGIAADMTRTFMQNVKVFSIDDNFQRREEGESSIAVKTILLLVTPEECELVMFATKLGELQLVMRSASDSDNVDTPGAGAKELLTGNYATDKGASPLPTNPAQLMNLLSDPKPEPKPEPLTPIPVTLPPRKVHVMVVLRGQNAEEVVFTEDGGLPETGEGGAPMNIGPTPAGREAADVPNANAGDDLPGDDVPDDDEPTNASAASDEE